MAACDLSEIRPAIGCYLCLSDKQLLAISVGLLCQILNRLDPMASCDVADLMADSHQYLAMDNHALQAAQTHLLCQITNTAGELGASGVVISTSDPVADPGVTSQIWINRTTGQVWYWNDGAGTWVLLIA